MSDSRLPFQPHEMHAGLSTDVPLSDRDASASDDSAHTLEVTWLRLLHDQIPTPCLTLDRQGTIQSVSRAGATLLGCEPEALCQTPLLQWVSAHDQGVFAEGLQQLSRLPKSPVEWQGHLVGSSGHLHRVTVVAQAVHQGDRVALLMVCQPVPHPDTSPPQAAPWSSLSQVWSAMEQLPLGIVYLDRDYRYRFVNPTYEAWFGCHRAALYGNPLSEQLDAQGFAVMHPQLDPVMKGHAVSYQVEVPHELGHSRHIAATLVPDFHADGSVRGCYGLLTDISTYICDRQQLEQALQQSKDQLQDILNTVFASIASLRLYDNHTWEYDYRSAGCEVIYGYTAEEMMRDRHLWMSRVWPTDLETVINPLFAKLLSGGVTTVEYRFRHKDGSIRWISNSYTSRRDEAAHCWRVIAVATDITPLKQLEMALRSSEDRLNNILNSAIATIVNFRLYRDRTHAYDYYSSGCETVYGFTVDEFINHPTLWLEQVLPDDQAVILPQVFEAIQAERAICVDYRFRHKDGSIRWINSIYSSRWDSAADCWRVTAVDTDITPLKQSEERLRKSQLNLALAQKIARIGNWEFDLATQKIDWSEELFRIYGHDPAQAEPTYADLLKKFDPDDAQQLQQVVQRAITHGEPYDLILKLPLADGAIRYVQSRGKPVRDETGTIVRLLGTTQDITAHKLLEHQLRAQTQREQALKLVIQTIRNSLDLQTVFMTAASEIGRLLQTYRVSIVQYLPEQETWLIQQEYRQDPTLTSRVGTHIPDRDNPIAQQLKQLQIVRIDDNRTVSDPVSQRMAQEFAARWLLIPLQVQGTVWGSLSLIRHLAMEGWKDWEVDLAHEVADQVAIAIQQSELYQQVQQLNTTLEQQVQERTAELQQMLEFDALLKRITDKVRDSLDETQILQTAVYELATGLNVKCCDSALYDLKRQVSEVCYEYITADVPSALGCTFPWQDEPVLYDQLLQGAALQFCLIEDVKSALRPVAHRFAMLCSPLRDDQGILGDIWLFKASDQGFDEQEIRLVQQVCNQCAIALRQSRLYQASQQQVEALATLNRLKDDFLSTVSHELRSPMANIKMATEMLELVLRQPGTVLADAERATQYFNILRDECDRETQLINDLLDLSRLDAGVEPLILTNMDLAAWLLHLVEAFQARTHLHDQRLHLNLAADLPPLTTDYAYLERILTELLVNACKYTPPGGQITVSIAAVAEPMTTQHPSPPSPAAFQIIVSNTGVEIPESERDRIFDKFYRIPSNDPWRYSGTGLGLALVKKRVEQMNGTIHVVSDNNETAFIVMLPNCSAESFPWKPL